MNLSERQVSGFLRRLDFSQQMPIDSLGLAQLGGIVPAIADG
jgi:hypothetical protein